MILDEIVFLVALKRGSISDFRTPKKSAIFSTFPGIGREVPFTYPVIVEGGILVPLAISTCFLFCSFNNLFILLEIIFIYSIS